MLTHKSDSSWTTLKVGTTLAQVTAPPDEPTIRYSRSAFDPSAQDLPASSSDRSLRAPGAPSRGY